MVHTFFKLFPSRGCKVVEWSRVSCSRLLSMEWEVRCLNLGAFKFYLLKLCLIQIQIIYNIFSRRVLSIGSFQDISRLVPFGQVVHSFFSWMRPSLVILDPVLNKWELLISLVLSQNLILNSSFPDAVITLQSVIG